MALTYEDAEGAPGKSTDDADIVEARFLEIDPGHQVVQPVEFVSDDPTMAGTMTMTWTATADGDGSLVEFRVAGMSSSLENLAAHLQR